MFGILAFSTILAASLAGMTFNHFMVIPLGALVLTAIATFENRTLFRRAYLGTQASQGFALVIAGGSFINGLVACGSAYLLGAVIATAFH